MSMGVIGRSRALAPLAALWLAFAGAAWAEPATETPATETPATETPATETPATETKSVEAETVDLDDAEDLHDGDAGHEPAGDHPAGDHSADGHGGHSSRLSAIPRPLATDTMPERPKPLVELGEPFLGTGTLDPGFELPTGAVWQPSALVFGSTRLAAQSFESDSPGGGRITEVAARLDLFVNVSLSGSERLVAGIRAFDGGGRFTSFFVEHPDPSLDGEFRDEFDADLELLFFEGDFGEIFPNLDRTDFNTFDLGFSVGRQPLLFQEGLLIDDVIDGVGITRNTLLPGNLSNLRATFFYGWDEVSTGLGQERDAEIFAFLASIDTRLSTIDADIAHVRADDGLGDVTVAGVSAVQRLGSANSSFRVLASQSDADNLVASDGVMLFSELSWVPKGTHDLVYVNNFWAIDRFTPAARGAGPLAGGPLGRAGINFASVGLGSFDAPLSSQAFDVAGGAVGYQRFYDHGRRQLLMEVGARFGTEASVADAYAATVRYQTALGRRFVVVVDGFLGYRELLGGGDQSPYGGRLELVTKF